MPGIIVDRRRPLRLTILVEPPHQANDQQATTEFSDNVEEESGAQATPLCPNCLAEITERTDSCPRCSTPVGAFSTLDPMKQIQSTGWLFRRAIDKGVSGVALLGLWVILGPPIFLLAIVFIYGGGRRIDGVFGLARLGIGILISVLYAAILFRVTKSYWHLKQSKPGHCIQCGYDLRLLTDPRCPECGRPFDPETIAEIIDESSDEPD